MAFRYQPAVEGEHDATSCTFFVGHLNADDNRCDRAGIRTRHKWQEMSDGTAMPLGEFQEDLRVGESLPLAPGGNSEHRQAVNAANDESQIAILGAAAMKPIRNRSIMFWISCLMLTFARLSMPAEAADYNLGSIHIAQPWARATPKGASSAAAYMTITNNGSTPDRLSCVSSEASAGCQIHSMAMDNGVMKMRPVEGGLEIKPGQTVMLKPSGFHVMLTDLKAPLEQGKTVEVTLRFEKAGTVKVELPIAAIGASGPGAMQMDHGSMHMDHH